ncbi:MAG: DUF1800 domain-containing protein [Ignavibacteriae bacterium]|nr:MAG: DUF1800 domain-containing protein [Ignavibacteriota bacterium]
MIDLSQRSTPLTVEDALHLLRRATFHPTWQAAQALVGKTPLQAVNTLLDASDSLASPAWASEPISTNQNEIVALWPKMQNWWLGHCLKTPSLRERLVALWSNTFTSDYLTVYYAQFMVGQNQAIRQNVYDFKAMGTAMVGDPAMLIYLNGNQSLKGNPNENFAREWFELFTLGIGNYTEADIVDAARAFTGWRVTGLTATYNRQLADLGEKTILGKTGNWEWQDVVRITFETDASARWVAKKLYKTFIEVNPDDAALDAIAALVRQNNFNIKPVLQTLLTSNGFYDATVRGALIKSPLDLMVGLAAVLGVPTLNPSYVASAMTGLTQTPFYPPTVEGWKGHHAWITSTTFPQRQRVGESFVDGRQMGSSTKLQNEAGQPLPINLVAVVKAMPGSDNADTVVENVAKLLLPIPVTAEQRAVLLDIMMAGLPASYWDIESPTAASRLLLLFQSIVRMPEFQLM